jgi:hypothetical protein
MQGYYLRREAAGILDPLYASAISAADGNCKWILITCDLLGISSVYISEAKALISKKIGIPKSDILIHCSHTHMGPVLEKVPAERIEKLGGQDDEYIAMLIRKLADAAKIASENMKEAVSDIACGYEDSVSFIRRFRMKDGSVKTNPGIGNPDIVCQLGEIDPSVGLVRFKYSDGSGEILVVNFTLHPDIIGGNRFSADYPGHMKNAIKKLIPNCEVIYVNGAAGDINHIDAMHPGNTSGGYEYSKKVGSILAAEVIKIYQRLNPIRSEKVISGNLFVEVPLRKITQEEKEKAEKLTEAFHRGSWNTQSMSDVADLAGSYQTLDILKLNGKVSLELSAAVAGEIAYVGLPGEVFADIGRRIKKNSPFKYTFISSLTNGSEGYFPTKKAFSEGGYETKNNPFTDELEDLLAENALKLLNNLKNKIGE